MPRTLVAAPPPAARAKRAVVRDERAAAAPALDLDLARLNGGLLAVEVAEPAAPRLALDLPSGVVPRREPGVWSEFFGLWV